MNRRVAIITKSDTSIVMTDPRPGIPSQREMDENYFVRTLDGIEAWLKVNEPSPAFVCVLRRFVHVMGGPKS